MTSLEQKHRNADPDDGTLFNGLRLQQLQTAVQELCWLLDRGYARPSAIKLVGDHHQLSKRQRLAMNRAGCSEDNKHRRAAKRIELKEVKGRSLIIDGFNLIITLEAAMAGAVLLRCRDGCIRDLASVHGTYHPVSETSAVIEMIGETLAFFAPASVDWLFDKPISNSGRLATLIRTKAGEHGWNWRAELQANPDRTIMTSDHIAITSDSAILDVASHWVNLTLYLIQRYFPNAWLIDFS